MLISSLLWVIFVIIDTVIFVALFLCCSYPSSCSEMSLLLSLLIVSAGWLLEGRGHILFSSLIN